jgi:hypothetical protein
VHLPLPANACSGDAKPATAIDAATAIATPAKATRSFGCKKNNIMFEIYKFIEEFQSALGFHHLDFV